MDGLYSRFFFLKTYYSFRMLFALHLIYLDIIPLIRDDVKTFSIMFVKSMKRVKTRHFIIIRSMIYYCIWYLMSYVMVLIHQLHCFELFWRSFFVHKKPSHISTGYSTYSMHTWLLSVTNPYNPMSVEDTVDPPNDILYEHPLIQSIDDTKERYDRPTQHRLSSGRYVPINSFNNQIQSDERQSDLHLSHMYTNNRYLCDTTRSLISWKSIHRTTFHGGSNTKPL
eukprot:217739_1